MAYKLIIGFMSIVIYLSACKSEIHSNDNKPFKKYTDIKINGKEEHLIPIYKEESAASPNGYVNEKGDTLIRLGEYSHCWAIDTFKTFAIVFDEKNTNSEIVAIDKEENVLFDIFLFDNYPDELSDGLFRVKRNDKIGFSNQKGQIIIPCKYAFAFPFETGRAKVTYKCSIESIGGDDEHWFPKSDEWFYIDTKGNKIK